MNLRAKRAAVAVRLSRSKIAPATGISLVNLTLSAMPAGVAEAEIRLGAPPLARADRRVQSAEPVTALPLLLALVPPIAGKAGAGVRADAVVVAAAHVFRIVGRDIETDRDLAVAI